MRAMIEINLPADTDFEHVRQILESVNNQLVPNFPEIVSGPSYSGPHNTANGLLTLKVVFYTLNGQQFNVHDHFLAKYLDVLGENGITLSKQSIVG